MKVFKMFFVLVCSLIFLASEISAQMSWKIRLEAKDRLQKFVPSSLPKLAKVQAGSTDIRGYSSANNQSEVSIAINTANLNKLLIGANSDPGQGYYYSTNAGTNWAGGDALPGVGYSSSDPAVAFDASGNAYFNYIEDVGSGYQLFVKKSTDGGDNWQSSPAPKMYGFDIDFLDKSNGWVSGWVQIFRTNDDGETWVKQLSDYINYRLAKLFILKEDKIAFILGVDPDANTSTLFKADLSNITDVEENKEAIPNKFYLYQNYPNPFNPSTIIRYQLSEFSHITLKVYDTLGREIATLVNENKLPGRHSAKFSTYNYHLPSGIYFARLTAGKYSKSIKLCLMR